MAEQVRQKAIRAFDPLDLPELRSADPGDADLDEHLAEAELWDFDLIELQRSFLLNEDGGGGFHVRLRIEEV
jgi:hypothetical protein